MSARRFVTICAAVSVLAAAAHADAFNLTGTWVGRWSCKGFDGVKFSEGNKESVMLITQTGSTVNVDLDGGGFIYNGKAIEDLAKPEKGEIVLSQCGTDNLPLTGSEGEIVRAQVKTKTDVIKATLKGLSIYEDDFPSTGTCKYSYKRTDTTNPNVGPCQS